MRAFFTAFVAIVSTPIQAAEPDPATLRARAALALAFAVPKPPTYAEAYARAVETGKPLVVFVGQPVREVSGCVCVGVESFPGARGERVVIGFPERKQLRRVDMPGRPSTDAIRAVVASPPSRANHRQSTVAERLSPGEDNPTSRHYSGRKSHGMVQQAE